MSIKYQPEYSMWLKRWKAHYDKIIYNNLITWKASFISFDYLSIENSSTRREQIFSVFNPLEINVFDQNWTKPKISGFILQTISWESKWYMTDLNMSCSISQDIALNVFWCLMIRQSASCLTQYTKICTVELTDEIKIS